MSTAVISYENLANQIHVFRGGFGRSSSPDAAPIVFVIHDDAFVRERLEMLVRSESWRPETFASAQQFLVRSRAVVPNCLVLDISGTGLNGLDLQKRLAIERPDMPIILIADDVDVPTTVKAIKAGAVELFTKPLQEDLLLNSIREALERSRVAVVHETETQALRDRYALLTARERQVMALVVSGLLNKQVGGELGITENTVKAHRGQVMQKMKAPSLAALVEKAERLGVTA